MIGKIAVIGNIDQILPFAAIGVEVCSVTNIDQAKKTLKKLVKDEFALIMITEDYAKDMMDIRMEYASLAIPAIISIPGKEGVTGSTLMQLRETLKYAVGADIMGET